MPQNLIIYGSFEFNATIGTLFQDIFSNSKLVFFFFLERILFMCNYYDDEIKLEEIVWSGKHERKKK